MWGAVTTLPSMARPFRIAAPSLRDDWIARTRLTERMAMRWSRRLVTVTAGPGFGKTTLLAAALADRRDDHHVDVWLACEPADEDAGYLLAGLADAFGVDPVRGVDDLVRAVWMRAPTRVSFVLDDVHEVPDGSTGAQLLAQLLDTLPRTASLVLASRTAPPAPIPTVRLTAAGDHHAIGEADLVFDDAEIGCFAAARRVDRGAIADAAGWPALAELSAAAVGDVMFDYVWDVVLEAAGPQRARELALLATVDGGDQEVADAITGAACDLGRLAGSVPLVEVRRDGWVVPHRLWEPATRRILDADERRAARLAAARVHAARRHYERAVDLFSDADAWDDVTALIRDVALNHGALEQWHRIGAWRHRLPEPLQASPIGRLAEGMDVASRVPLDAVAPFHAAVAGFRDRGDSEGELAAMERLGVVMWWAGDVGGLWELYQRAVELRDGGLQRAEVVTRVGEAAIAHLTGDPDGVLAALEPVSNADMTAWAPSIHWFRHVAHRRRGDLERAELGLDLMARVPGAAGDPQVTLARLRTDWLLGRVDGVAARCYETAERYAPDDQRYLRTEAATEAAARAAWLGDRRSASRILGEVAPRMDAAPGPLGRVLRAIAEAAVAVDRGDDAAAADVLAACDLARPGLAESWYWCDRTAVALVHQLRADDRDGWAVDAAHPVHHLGVRLSEVLAAVRAGDLRPVAELEWPPAGLVRAHLPARWVRELVDAAETAGNPAPFELLDAISTAPMEPSAALSATDGVVPLDVLVLGPLTLRRGGVDVEGPDLRRGRVRELLSLLAVDPVQRRDAVADAMWPDHPDPRHNLRVTLSYLRRALGIDDGPSDGGLRADASTIRLAPGAALRCDLWQFDAHLRAAAAFERAGDPVNALDAYTAAMALWRGTPFVDLHVERLALAARRLCGDFVRAALRAGELWLAAGDVDAAMHAGRAALAADPLDESAHRLVIRAHVASGDRGRARAALEDCVAALAEIHVVPDPATLALVDPR